MRLGTMLKTGLTGTFKVSLSKNHFGTGTLEKIKIYMVSQKINRSEIFVVFVVSKTKDIKDFQGLDQNAGRNARVFFLSRSDEITTYLSLFVLYVEVRAVQGFWRSFFFNSIHISLVNFFVRLWEIMKRQPSTVDSEDTGTLVMGVFRSVIFNTLVFN